MAQGQESTFFFFNDTATTEIYTLPLHDALPISGTGNSICYESLPWSRRPPRECRSEEHTSELQSQSNLVCRLLLEKKKTPLSSVPHALSCAALSASRKFQT